MVGLITQMMVVDYVVRNIVVVLIKTGLWMKSDE